MFLLRFILQTIRADFYNPFSQFIVRVTNPLVVPARRLLPSFGGLDIPTLIVLVILQGIVTYVLIKLAGRVVSVDTYFLYVGLRLISLTIWTYKICLIGYVILSWVAQANYSPFALVLGQIVAPLLRPVRRILPTIGAFDFSALIVLLILHAITLELPLPPYLR